MSLLVAPSCKRFEKFFAKHSRAHIQIFIAIYIEGREPAALAGFDLDRFQPTLVCLAASPTIRSAIAAYFERHGYERIDEYLKVDAVNWYYTPRRTPPAR